MPGRGMIPKCLPTGKSFNKVLLPPPSPTSVSTRTPRQIGPELQAPDSPENRPRSHRPRGRYRRLLVFAAVVWTVGTLAVLWVVCTSAGRAVLLRAISGEIEQKTGWSVGFGDTELSLRQGLLTLRDVTTGAPASAPVVQVSEIRAQWSWDTLFEDGLWTLDELALANPQVDLEAPFPTTEPTGAPPEPSPLPLVLQAWTIEAGEVRGRSMDEGWLEHWSIRDLHAAGAFTRGTLRGEIQRGTGTLAPRQPDAESEVWTRLAVPAESTDITLGGRFEGALQGPWTIDELKLLGQGIRLTGSSSLGRSADPAQLRFELDLQPGAWAPGLRGSGTIQAQGELDLRALQGELTVHAPDLPLEILEPFVSATIFDGLGARGTTMGLELDLQLDGPDPARAKGGARWQWSRRDRPGAPLGNFTATVTSAGALDLDAQLLPHFPGTLRASGTLVTEDLRRLELLRIEGGRLTVESASAGELRRALAPFWPAIPELADGALSLQVKASGKGGGPCAPDSWPLPSHGQAVEPAMAGQGRHTAQRRGRCAVGRYPSR